MSSSIPDSVWITYRYDGGGYGRRPNLTVKGVYATRKAASDAKWDGWGLRMKKIKLARRLANGQRLSLIEGATVEPGTTVEVTVNERFKHLYVVGEQNTICGAADRWGNIVPVKDGFAQGIKPILPDKKYHECRKCWK